MDNRILYWYDPYQNGEKCGTSARAASGYAKAGKQALTVLFRFLNDEWKRIKGDAQPLHPQFTIVEKPHAYFPTQVDSYSCGVFVCAYMLLHGSLGLTASEAQQISQHLDPNGKGKKEQEISVRQIRLSVIEFILRNADGFPTSTHKWKDAWKGSPLIVSHTAV